MPISTRLTRVGSEKMPTRRPWDVGIALGLAVIQQIHERIQFAGPEGLQGRKMRVIQPWLAQHPLSTTAAYWVMGSECYPSMRKITKLRARSGPSS